MFYWLRRCKSNTLINNHFIIKYKVHGIWSSGVDPGISKPVGAIPARQNILRSGVCFDASSHLPYAFVVRVVNNINIVNIVKIYKNKPQFFFKPGGAHPAPRSRIRLWSSGAVAVQFRDIPQRHCFSMLLFIL